MAISSSMSRANQVTLTHLRALRLSVDQARSLLMHFKEDRIDRDKLEPAARRIDDLVNLFAAGTSDLAQSVAWMSEIRVVINSVENPKSAAALSAAGVEVSALLALMASQSLPAGEVLPA